MGILGRVFADRDWRDDLDSELVRKLEKLLKRTKTYENAYKSADNPAMAQLWVAMAEMFYQMERMNARMRKMEQMQKRVIEGIEKGEIEDEELRKSLENY